MATSSQPPARFRSATEFPKTIEGLDHSAANEMYAEMRDCLIFTNRSRSQLIRRNEEHKQSIVSLRNDLARFQFAIDQLNLEKQGLAQDGREIRAALQNEIGTMASHLDQLSKAFEDVEGISGAMGAMAIPGKFARFWQALKALIVWWRDEQGYDLPETTLVNGSGKDLDSDRRENPQMYTDPASVQRSLRDE